jgi:hypothetical protein
MIAIEVLFYSERSNAEKTASRQFLAWLMPESKFLLVTMESEAANPDVPDTRKTNEKETQN